MLCSGASNVEWQSLTIPDSEESPDCDLNRKMQSQEAACSNQGQLWLPAATFLWRSCSPSVCGPAQDEAWSTLLSAKMILAPCIGMCSCVCPVDTATAHIATCEGLLSLTGAPLCAGATDQLAQTEQNLSGCSLEALPANGSSSDGRTEASPNQQASQQQRSQSLPPSSRLVSQQHASQAQAPGAPALPPGHPAEPLKILSQPREAFAGAPAGPVEHAVGMEHQSAGLHSSAPAPSEQLCNAPPLTPQKGRTQDHGPGLGQRRRSNSPGALPGNEGPTSRCPHARARFSTPASAGPSGQLRRSKRHKSRQEGKQGVAAHGQGQQPGNRIPQPSSSCSRRVPETPDSAPRRSQPNASPGKLLSHCQA